MIPILYPAEERTFTTQGLGRLSDCLRCIVIEERNGIYECEFDYPITGEHYSEISEGMIVGCIHDDQKDIQPFEIYARTAPLDGVVTFYAHHISYRLGNIILKPMSASSVAQAFATFPAHTMTDCPFTFWTDKVTTGTWKTDVPVSIKEILGGTEGSILDVYGKADYQWDKFAVKLYQNRGADTGVEIRYGKNLTDLTQEIDISGTYTAVAPYWADSEGDTVVYLPEGYVVASDAPKAYGTLTDEKRDAITAETGEALEFGYTVVQPVPLDLSEKWETAPTVSQLRDKAQDILDASDAWVPDENIEVNFVALWQTEEYAAVAPLQRVSLCDKVSVIYSELGVNAKLQIVRVEYNVLLERYNEMELGKPSVSFADVVRGSTESAILKQVPTVSMMQQAIDAATDLISGGLGGHVVFNYNAAGQPNEILILDTEDKDTAVHVLRINENGIGFSSTGYNGTYTTAWTLDGNFVADYITTGTLNANLLRTGIITDQAGRNYWNLLTGEISISYEADPGDEVTQADLARVQNNAQTYANTAEQNAKDYVDQELLDVPTNSEMTGAISSSAAGLRTEFANTYSPKSETTSQVQLWYYRSTSPNQLFGGSWSQTAPQWEEGTFVWQKFRYIKADNTYTESDPVCVTGNSGEDAQESYDGKDALYLYITSDKSTYVAKGETSTVVLTACLGQGDSIDIDPTGEYYSYLWYMATDDDESLPYKSGKNLTITVNDNFCEDRASLRVAIVEDEYLLLQDHNGTVIETHDGVGIEVL